MSYPISSTNPIRQVPAPKFTKNNQPVVPKFDNPEQVRGIYMADWDADVDNRLSRAYVQGMMEGKPPYSPQRMKEAGLAGCCNIDWRQGQLAIRRKMEPYVTALLSLPTFLNIKTKYGSPQQRNAWGRMISQQHAKLLRSWDSFPFRYQYSVLYLVSHGVSFCYFNNDIDWRWHVSTLGDMVIPRLSKADVAELDRMGMSKDYQPFDLWQEIKEAVRNKWEWTRPETKDGWHVPTVINAMKEAGWKEFFKTNDWERNEMLMKNQEVVFSQSSKVIPAILMWNKEDNGAVTQYIVTKNQMRLKKKRGGEETGGEEAEQFMYRRVGHFSSMSRAVITFARDIGTNGYIHSIRGTGRDIFPVVQELNKMKCSAYDAMKIEMSIPVQAPDEVWNSDMAYVQAGPFTLIRDGVKGFEIKSRNFANTVFPGMQMLNADLAEQSGQSRMPEQPGSKVDMEELLSNLSGIDVMENFLWSISWERLLREQLRRLLAIKVQEQPGGSEAMIFRKWCKEAGIPDQALDQIDIDDCVAVRPIGNGSPQARMYTMNAMKEYAPFFDEEGRNAWVRDGVASLPGMHWSSVDRYVQEEIDMRPTQQVRDANKENVLLKVCGTLDGTQFFGPNDVPVLPNDDHITHLEQHAPSMEDLVNKVDQGAMTMEDAVRPLFPLYLHSTAHTEAAMENPIMKAQLAEFRRALHNVGEIITNGQRKLMAREKKRQENLAKGLDEDGNPLPGEGDDSNRKIYPDPLGTGQMLSVSEFSEVARAQVHLQDAARSQARADEIHSMKIESMRQDAADKQLSTREKARSSRQKRQINDLKASISLVP